jgi:hypothetical protein
MGVLGGVFCPAWDGRRTRRGPPKNHTAPTCNRSRNSNNSRSGRPCIVGICEQVTRRRTSQTEAGTKTRAKGGEDKKFWAWCFEDGPSSRCSSSPIGVDLDAAKLFSHAPRLITPPPRVLRGCWCAFSQFFLKRWVMRPPD